jgi:uncharacterized protein (DUF58 family)
VAWELVAHNSGAGWVQAVGDLLAGVLVVGLLAPSVFAWRARVAVVDAPPDATAGFPIELRVDASVRVRVQPIDPPGPHVFVGAKRPMGTICVIPARRGVHDVVVLDVASAAPFGLMWWSKRVDVALRRPLVVAPRMGEPAWRPPSPDLVLPDPAAAGAARRPVEVGEPRGVRPYRPGDLRRFVHWPATAHSARLMVREMEGPSAEPVTVEIRLPHDDEAAERLAERGLATVVALIDRGVPVVLATVEATGPRTELVADRRAAGRRLAHAANGSDDTLAALAVLARPVRQGARR